jgi:hypothetical protein
LACWASVIGTLSNVDAESSWSSPAGTPWAVAGVDEISAAKAAELAITLKVRMVFDMMVLFDCCAHHRQGRVFKCRQADWSASLSATNSLTVE